MKKISTGLSIILAFILIALIFGFVGFMGIVGIEKINTNGDRLYTKNTMGISYSGNAALSFDMVQLNMMKLGILTDKEEKQQTITEIKNELNDLDTWLAQYESTINQNDEDNLTLFDSLKQNWEKYKGFVSYSLGYCSDNAGLDLSRFTSEFVLEKKELSDTIDKMFLSMVKLNQDSASSVNQQNAALGESTVLLMLILVPLGIIISIILGIIFGKSISKTVKRTSSQLKKIADGKNVEDLDVNQFSGEFAAIATNLNAVQASLQRLLYDAGALAAAGIEGKLSTRADLSVHKGNYRAIIEDFNKSLDAFTTPVNEIVEVLKAMQQGNLRVSVTGDYPGDYADIKEALNDTIRTINGYVVEVSTILEKMSVGDITHSIDTEYRGDFLTLRDSINRINESLNALLKDILLSANQVAAGTRHVSDGSQSISIGATEQASAIEQLTATVSHIAEQTKLNAEHAGQAKTLSQDVGTSAKGGDTDMEHMQQAMIDIRSSSENISRIIKVIDDIAFQTNILALNAAVEAARAGAHGRGFAVVADEVRNLAVRSAKAAAETTDLIENSIQKVQQGSNIANQTAQSLRKILAGIESTATLVSDIADASNQQASAIIQVNSGIENLTGVVQNNSATSEETAAAAQELSSQAEMLRSMVRQFTLNEDATDNGSVRSEEPALLYEPAANEAPIDLNADDFGKY